MRKTAKKSLALSSESVRKLNDGELKIAAGGLSGGPWRKGWSCDSCPSTSPRSCGCPDQN